MIYGNHDIVKRRKTYPCQCASYYCDCDRCDKPLFPGLEIPESLVLENRQTGQRLLLAVSYTHLPHSYTVQLV